VVIRTLDEKPWNTLRWLVLAPHADDETLGAGALIAQTAASGLFAGLVYLTDGSGSHETPHGRAGRLIATRRREAATALFRLTGKRKPSPVHLAWKDAAPHGVDGPAFTRTVAKLAALCRRRKVDAIAVTALHEPHCDHAAAALVAYAVASAAKRQLIVVEYCVWSELPSECRSKAVRTRPMPTGRRRYALQAHRSQLTASHGPGFRLPQIRQRMPACDMLFSGRLI
jgi:LmbE family N-acetylglucosaminyl deacetylase